MELIIKSVNISEKKGTVKKPVSEIEITQRGIKNDAHSGTWHRQISLLSQESISKFSKEYKKEFNYGDFAENITTEGIDLTKVKLLDRLVNDTIDLQVTQIGKKCHVGGCAIYKEVGECLMPKEGIFARVIKQGVLKPDDKLIYKPKVFKTGIITLSDRASKGEYEDQSGPLIKELNEKFFTEIERPFEIELFVIADNRRKLKNILGKLFRACDVIFTTGGTGISKKDITIEAVAHYLDKQIPGITEMIRIKYGQDNPKALISRSIAGVKDKTLVFCMPGSPKAVKEYMEEILKVLEHLVYMAYGLDVH